MKNKILFTLICVFSTLIICAQGVNFQELTLDEATKKAKAENKLIFLDCSLEGCSPCKHMAYEIFPLKEVGDYFNKRFVSVKFDIQKGEGKDIAARYKTRAYPTYLILNTDQEEQYRIVGSKDVEGLILSIEHGLKPKNSLAALEKEYQSGKMKTDRMYNYIYALSDAYEQAKANQIKDEFISSFNEKEKASPKYAKYFVDNNISPVTPERLSLIVNDLKRYRKSAGEEKVNYNLTSGYDQLLNSYFAGQLNDKGVLEKMKTDIAKLDIPARKRLSVKADIALASIDNDMEKALILIEENCNLFEHLDYLYVFTIFGKVDTNNKALMARMVNMEEAVISIIGDESYQSSLRSQFETFKAYASTGVYWYNLSLKEAQAMAQRMRKLVFLDCYTTWCGPCKRMTERVFPQEKVGDFFNKNFICIKIDMEKGEGPELADRFDIKAYPTFLIIRPDGTIQHRIVGGGDGDKIIKDASDGLNPETSTSSFDKKYEDGDRSKEFLTSYSKQLLSVYEYDKAKEVSHELLARLSDNEKTSPEFWYLFSSSYLIGPDSEYFTFFTKNLNTFIKNIGNDEINKKFNDIATFIVLGYDKTTTATDIDKMKRVIISYKLPNQKSLVANLEVTKAYLSKNPTQLLKVSQAQLKNMNDDSIRLMIDVLIYLQKEIREDQKVQLDTLIDSYINSLKDEQMQKMIKAQLNI